MTHLILFAVCLWIGLDAIIVWAWCRITERNSR